MTPCNTCHYDQPRTKPERGGRAEDHRAHSQHAHTIADQLQGRETSHTQARSVRRHAFHIADKGDEITAAEIHAGKRHAA